MFAFMVRIRKKKYLKFREIFESEFGTIPPGSNKHLKSIRYYLVHDDIGEAFNQYRKFERCY